MEEAALRSGDDSMGVKTCWGRGKIDGGGWGYNERRWRWKHVGRL